MITYSKKYTPHDPAVNEAKLQIIYLNIECQVIKVLFILTGVILESR